MEENINIPQPATALEVKSSQICIGRVTTPMPNNTVTGHGYVMNGMAQSLAIAMTNHNFKKSQI